MKQLGRYEIIEELGRGAMGAVYKARDPVMDRDVAVKTILAHAIEGPEGAQFRERFVREAKAAGRLAHPGIITLFDVFDHENTPCLVMEYVAGQTLQSILQSGIRLDVDQVCDWAIQLAEALDYAHLNGVIHRDIKPANILITKDKRTKIADFGVAKLAESQVTITGQTLGTPAYMAPEQFAGLPVDGRADLFALGVVIYWMATGDKPFSGDTILSVQYKVMNTDPVPPRKLNPALPSSLESVILKSLQKDPAQRYQSGEELARELQALRTGRKSAAATRVVHVPIRPSRDERTELLAGDTDATVKLSRSFAFVNRRILFMSGVVALVLAVAGIAVWRTLTNSPSAPTVTIVAPSSPVPAPVPPVTGEPASSPPGKAATRPTDRVPAPAGKTESRRSSATAAKTPSKSPQPSTIPAQPTPVPAENRSLNDSVARGRDLKDAFNARLLITSVPLPPGVTVIISANNNLLLRRDSVTAPLAEEVSLPPGRHRIEVNFLLSAQRIGRTHEFTERFVPGQRRTLNIQFFPEPQRRGVPGRVNVTLK
jgi:serine/threonine-protein kinase